MTALRPVLQAVVVAGVAAGGVLLAWPASARGTEDAVSALPEALSLPVRSATTDSLAMELVMGNPFAASRRPPRRPWAPSDSAESGASMDAEPGATPADSAAGITVPALLGTVVGDGSVLALLHLSPADQGPRLYAVGERGGRYRVVSITPRAVILHGPQGRVTLRLPDEERP